MDWQGTSSEALKSVDLALIKVEAKVPVTDRTYGGAVVLNPGAMIYSLSLSPYIWHKCSSLSIGGPGGSGVGQVLRGGHAVRTMLSAGPDAEDDTARVWSASIYLSVTSKFSDGAELTAASTST